MAVVQTAPQTRSRPQTARPSPGVSATPGGRERMRTAQPVCLGNTRTSQGLQNAVLVRRANIQMLSMHPQTGVHTVPLLQYLQLAASQKAPVNVTLGTREKMEARARSAALARIKLNWGLQLVQTVLLHRPLQLAAPRKLHVNVTLDTRDQMETHARSAPPALTNLDWGLIVQTVPLILCL